MITYTDKIISPDMINQVRRSVGWRAHDKERYTEALAHTVYCQMAYDQTRPVGVARLIGDGIYYMLVDVAVDPAYQKQGIGQTMVSNILNYIRLQTQQTCIILLNASYGKEAFYEKLGFQKLNTGTAMELRISGK